MTVALCPNCKPHAFQDKKYGPKKRVMNPAKGGDVIRCTVCGAEKNAGSVDTPKKKK